PNGTHAAVRGVPHHPPSPPPGERVPAERPRAEDNQVPRVVGGQRLLQDHVPRGAENRPLDRAEPADDGHERHLRGELHAEHRARLHLELADPPQPAPPPPPPPPPHHHPPPAHPHPP